MQLEEKWDKNEKSKAIMKVNVMNDYFKDKIVLITGGSKGIGRATAKLFSKSSAKVIINYMKSEVEAINIKEEIENDGGIAYLQKADVSDITSVTAMFKNINESIGEVDILINNAGINERSYLIYMKESQWSNVIDINLKGTFLCSKAALKSMTKNKFGRIVNVSSIAYIKTGINQSHYAASKAGIVALTKSMAKEYGRFGIRVNAVAPGPIYTDLNKMSSEEEKEVIKLTPLKQVGKAEEIANIIYFLSSDTSSYITGETIVADGGLTL